MKNILIFGTLLALMVSCGDAEEILVEEVAEVWVCHNPLSKLHGSICVEEVNVIRGRYQPCFYSGHQKIEDSFCWLLRREDCSSAGEQRLEWQERHCPLLEE